MKKRYFSHPNEWMVCQSQLTVTPSTLLDTMFCFAQSGATSVCFTVPYNVAISRQFSTNVLIFTIAPLCISFYVCSGYTLLREA